ncbi:hypothetical protein ES703_83980 [subsurface metagenome]
MLRDCWRDKQAHHVDVPVGPPGGNHRLAVDLLSHLPVQGQGDALLGLLEADDDLVRAGHDDGAGREGMRADGGNGQGVQGGHHDGAPGRQGIGRGTGGSGHDQAVGHVVVEPAPGDLHPGVQQPGRAAAVDHYVVDGVVGLDLPPVLQVHGQHHALFQAVLAVQDSLQRLKGVGDGNLRQEAQAAHVDAQDGDFSLADNPGRGEDGAVAADGEHHVHVPDDGGRGVDLNLLGRLVIGACQAVGNGHGAVVLQQPVHQWGQETPQVGLAVVGDNTEGFH